MRIDWLIPEEDTAS